MQIRYVFSISLLALLLASGCSKPVLKQDIPVTTNPLGAKILANGQPMGQTPSSVSLERNRDHILTLLKDGYRQEDVVVKRKYQSEKVFLKAVKSGVNSGLFFKDPRMAINSGYSAMEQQEESGEAYLLEPPTVSVTLTPLSGSPPSASKAPQSGTSAAVDSTPTASQGLSTADFLKAGIIAGAAVGASQMKPVEKKWDTSSSSKSYVTSDGTRVTEKSGTSVGVGINPAGLINALDILFK